MAATLDDVVAAIKNMGATQGAQSSDSPEEIQRRFDALDAENEALERQRRLIENRSASAQRDQALRDNEIQQSRLFEQRLETLTAAYAANGEATSEAGKEAQKAQHSSGGDNVRTAAHHENFFQRKVLMTSR